MTYQYVTLVTNPDDYLVGVRALARSMQMCQTKYPLTILTTQHIAQANELEALGCTIQLVDPLPLSQAFQDRHSREAQHTQAPFTKGNKPSFHNPLHNFVKLRCWELPYEKIFFLDADTLMIQNMDHLFEFPGFVAAPNVYESLSDFHRMNSGVFVAKPDREIFDDMLSELDQPNVFWRRTDQTFLQHYFPKWHGLPYIYNTLQYVWFNLPQLWDWESIHLIHYQYEKPWENNHPKFEQLQPLIELWQHVYETGELPQPLPRVPITS